MFLAIDYHKSPLTPAQRVQDACERYVEKFGNKPNLCCASIDEADAIAKVTDLPVRGMHVVQPHCLYVGCE